jgi:hypothetical protein
MKQRHLAAFLVGAAVLGGSLGSNDARADIPPPNSSQCRSKNAGDVCKTDDGKSGACAPSKCAHRTVSPDGGLVFEQVDCLECAPADGAKAAASGGTSGVGAPAPTNSAAPSSGKSGCAVGPVGSSELGSALALIGVAVACGLRRSRRAR